MKKIVLSVFAALICLTLQAQLNYSFTNCKLTSSSYTDIAALGTAIPMTNAESGTSASPINIGFGFNFNGTVFTQCMIHADGILKFGTTAPGTSTIIAPSPFNSYTNVFSNTTAAFQDIVMPLFCDLVQGSAAPQYHLLTTGAVPNRVTTIQWKNLRDADNPGSTLQHQFDNMEFQIKLYETTNDIEMVYGTWVASSSDASIRGSAIGIKSNSSNFISYTKSGALLNFNTGDFTDPALTSIGRIFFIEKSVRPAAGTSLRYFGKLTNDVNVAELYVDDAVPQSVTTAKNIQALIKNEGSAAATNIQVTITVSGVNNHTETISIAGLAAGAAEVVSFTPFVAAAKGLQTVNISVSASIDDRIANNSMQAKQTVTGGFLKTYNEDKNSANGFGFNGVTSMVATKIFSAGTKTIAQIRTSFNTYNVPVDIRIYEDDGGAGTPGSFPVFTSPAFLTNAQSETLVPVSPAITVTGDYYVVVAQRGTINMGLDYFIQYPKLPQKIFNAGLDLNNWIESTTAFNTLIAVVEQTNTVDVGFEKITSPVCSQTNNEIVKATIRNFSNQVHNYAANPVTISGFVKNEVTNTTVPFSFIKNTGTIAAGGRDTITLLNSYDITSKGNHLFVVKTTCAADNEPLNDSLNFYIFTKVFISGAPLDSICPNTSVILTNNSAGYLRSPFSFGTASDGTTFPFGSTTITVTPTGTTTYYASGVDYRGCTLTDSVVIKVRQLGVPSAPVISTADSILSFRNDFSVVLNIAALAGHTITWQSSGTISNAGSTNTVSATNAAGSNDTHKAFYTRIADGCSSVFGTPVSTKYATGILINDNTVTNVCDTSFYDDGGSVNTYSTQTYTKTYSPTDAGKKLKLTINKFNFGQFSLLRIYDGTDINAPLIGRLDRLTAAAPKYEFVASNPAGILTIQFSGNSINAAGFIGGLTCQTPLQYRTVTDGIFTNAAIWESRPMGSLNFSAANRSPNKGDDTIWVMHNVNLNSSLPLDQVLIETSGNMQVTGANTNLNMYKTIPANELTIKGVFVTSAGTFFGSNSANVALFGTLINNVQMQADTVFVSGNAALATINGTGSMPKLFVNNPQGVSINGNQDITEELALINGVVKVNAANFIRMKSGLGPIITGANPNSYVEGKLRWQKFSTTDSIVFPVGKNGIYRKFILLANQTSFDDFVEYEAELFSGLPPARTLPATFSNINQQWHHTVSITDGSARFTDATATIYYQAIDGVSNPSALRIGKDDGSTNWLDLGGSGTSASAGSITSNSFSSFSDFVLANLTGGSLPVTLLNFHATLLNKTVQLNWLAENEIHFSGYEIERSTNGSSFTKVGWLAANRRSIASSYQFMDVALPATQLVYYRLKMLDADGRFCYSNIELVKLTTQLTNQIITVSPNPFENNFTIQYQSAHHQPIQLQLLDAAGKILQQQTYQVQQGINAWQVQAGNLPKGLYLLKLIAAENIQTYKLQKK